MLFAPTAMGRREKGQATVETPKGMTMSTAREIM
jgi:hypothetical protein